MSNFGEERNRGERTSEQRIKQTAADRQAHATQVFSSGEPRHRRSTQTRSENTRSEYGGQSDGGKRRGKWLPAVLILAAFVLLCAGAYRILPDDSRIKSAVRGVLHGGAETGQGTPAQKDPVLEFKTDRDTYTVGARVVFQLTCDPSVVNVRIYDRNGAEVPGSSARISEESRSIWTVTVLFEEPCEGVFRPGVLDSSNNLILSEKTLSLTVTVPTASPVPSPTPLPTQAPVATASSGAVATFAVPSASPGQTSAPVVVQATTQISYVQITAQPAQTASTAEPVPTAASAPAETAPTAAETAPSAEPTQVPATPVPTEEPTPVPTATPLPVSGDAAPPSALGISEGVYSGSAAQSSYTRKASLLIQDADRYSYHDAGVYAFRGDNFRRNAAFGTAEVAQGTLEEVWAFDMGGLRTADYGTLYGLGWNSQPAIIKWSKEVRESMNLDEESRTESAMREVIFAAQDGKVYFVNLTTGKASRPPISIGYPLRGSVSVDTRGRPLISFGQAISKLSDKTGAIGFYLYNLLDQSRAYFLNGRSNDNQTQYSSNGAFDGSALFLHENGIDALAVAGENGLVYTIELNGKFECPTPDKPDKTASLDISPAVIYNKSIARNEKEGRTTIESGIAMYASYLYAADGYGILRCIDTDTMKTVWAFDTGDNTDAAVALDLTEDGLNLYTGNTCYSRLKKTDPVSIRRLNALTGEEIWSYSVPCEKNTDEMSGCKASPVIGQHDLDGLVFFTVNKVTGGGAKLIALNKRDGSLAWEFSMAESVSSPVAVYNAGGNGWIIQADSKGNIYVLDGLTGYLNSTAQVEGRIEGSPAVYRDMLVIGTCSKNPKMYCFKIK